MLSYRLDCSGGQAETKRRIYETNLRERGLELEHESAEVCVNVCMSQINIIGSLFSLTDRYLIIFLINKYIQYTIYMHTN